MAGLVSLVLACLFPIVAVLEISLVFDLAEDGYFVTPDSDRDSRVKLLLLAPSLHFIFLGTRIGATWLMGGCFDLSEWELCSK